MTRKSAPWFRSSKNSWYITVDGRRISLGVRGEENEADAVKSWHKLMALAKDEKPSKPKHEPTVCEVITAFLANADGRMKPKTVKWYAAFLTPFAEHYGSVKASALKVEQAESYARKPKWSQSTRHDFLGVLASAFRFAERTEMIERTPLRHLHKPPKASRGETALVSPEDHAVLLAHATPAFKPFLIVLHATGARPSEVASITAENLDADAGLVRLRDHKTAHHGKKRVLYLTPEAVSILRKLKNKYGEGVLLRTKAIVDPIV
jgi:integrase